jgi:demethylmenaquinone methyltransferase/2-methoxy-6-polyprenyl-1,4-benzoquinol methylase
MQDAGYVRQAFAKIAPRYILANHLLSLGIDVLWRRFTTRKIRQQAPARLLDLATGSGDLLAAIRNACPQTQSIGADFSIPMLRQAQQRRIHSIIAADGLALPFKSAAFDALTVAFGLRNMASWPAALQEMSRVIKPGGRLYVLDFSQPTLPGFRQLYLFYLKQIMPRIAGLVTGQAAAYHYLCGSIERFPFGPAMEQLINSNGFQNASTHRLSLGIASLYIAEKTSA